jgi:NAD(P)H-dependent nitrite reductase small subunit
MSEFHPVCEVDDVAEGEGTTVRVCNKLIAVFCQGGQFYAIDDMCPHMGASLSAGYVENGVVTCPWHAWRFRITDGTWADNPRIKIGSYPVRVVGNEVQVQVETAPPAGPKQQES